MFNSLFISKNKILGVICLDGRFSNMLPIIIATISGIAMAIQGSSNSLMSKSLGLFGTTFTVLGLGALLTGILMTTGAKKFMSLEQTTGSLLKIKEVPLIAFISIPLGIIIVWAVAYSIKKLGAGMTTSVIITSQVIMAYIIDHFGWFGVEKLSFSPLKLIAIAFLSASAFILLKQ